jgi:hypothetical protein
VEVFGQPGHRDVSFAPDAEGDCAFAGIATAEARQFVRSEGGGAQAFAEQGLGTGEVMGLVDGAAPVGAAFDGGNGFGREGEESFGEDLAAPVPAAPEVSAARIGRQGRQAAAGAGFFSGAIVESLDEATAALGGFWKTKGGEAIGCGDPSGAAPGWESVAAGGAAPHVVEDTLLLRRFDQAGADGVEVDISRGARSSIRRCGLRWGWLCSGRQRGGPRDGGEY